jgi:signal transduction histidine kinase
MKTAALFLSFFLTVKGLCASGDQSQTPIDSLKYEFLTCSEDRSRSELLIKIGQNFEGTEPDSAIHYYKKALDLSRKSNDTLGIISYYTNVTYVYNTLGRYDTSLILNLESVELARKFNNPERFAACINNLATSYYYLEQYDSAIVNYLRTESILIELGETDRLGILYSNLSGIFNDIGNYQRALEYSDKALLIARRTEDPRTLIMTINNRSITLIDLGSYDEAIKILKEGIVLCREREDHFSLNKMLTNLGNTYLRTGMYDEAHLVYSEGLTLAQSVNDPDGMITHLRGLAYCYFFNKEFDQAMVYTNRSEEVAERMDSKYQMQINNLLLSDINLALGKLNEYRHYRAVSDSVGDLILNERIHENLQKLEEQYKAGLREQEIIRLESEQAVQKLQYRTRLFILVTISGIALTALVVTILLLQSGRNKRKILENEKIIHQQRINELEIEKHLAASEAVLKGQEEERIRLAKDLHDGLGGMLSGIKYSFSNMKDNLIMTPENMRAFERGMDMLDSSISELRRVAHNMMPESLIRFGLEASVRDICSYINSSGLLKVNFHSIGLDDFKADQQVQIFIYRVIQELLSNIVKHAAAGSAIVQLTYSEGKMTIIVEDDGKGFDTGIIGKSMGIGFSNMQSRVDYLGGHMEIQSEPGKGTTVVVELEA